MFSKETYVKRREQLKKEVGSGILLFLGNDESGMNYKDNTYPYRQDSTFLYFFGLSSAGLSAVIDLDSGQEIIFGNELTIDDIVWMGTLPSLRERGFEVGITDTRPLNACAGFLREAMDKGRTIHYLPVYRPEHSLKLYDWLSVEPDAEKPSEEFIRAVVAQRSYKTPEEIEQIESACDFTTDMHVEAMKKVRVGMKEWEIVAAVEKITAAAGGRTSFPTIATVNGQTLHNHYHGNTVKEGDMFLLDCGMENAMGYSGDMSSTIPAGKKFTSRQKDVYDIQLASHYAAVEALRPGVRFEEVYDLSCKVICEGMKSLGLMKGDAEEAVRAGAHAMFFPCGLGHMMGLDIHDMENLGEVWVGYAGKPKSTQFGRKSLRLARELEPGFVVTIEPGIYFIPELIDMWKAENKFSEFLNYDKLEEYRDFGGIRNEECYLITPEGKRRLGKYKPMTTDEVEALR